MVGDIALVDKRRFCVFLQDLDYTIIAFLDRIFSLAIYQET